ncbi:protein WEAK CHLOROPLAST MOVEMENT UNDER BLUE LIGHT 1-like [Nicotiana tomentosiformis]|uniref:protein WEAK CHLOROPLAST MOVEMENT UNDER BLUE LIGHT 1-like n=1 Tax=Nicotiana tomentosiformis TaxID=4098 RepID=UPI00388CAAC3
MSKTVPQKKIASSSRSAGGEDVEEPRPEEFVLVECLSVGDFKIEKPSPIPGRCEPMSRTRERCSHKTPSGGEEVPVLKQASVLHHEAFLRIREEHDAKVWSLTEKSDSYKLLSEKRRAYLTAAQEEHEEMTEQVRQRIEQIGRLNSQVDALLADAEEFKKCMDILASKKEAIKAQLELSDAQLRSAKENASGLIEKMKELHHQLDLATSDKADLAKELEVARSESMVEHAKWQARREALEEVRAQGFDIGAEIEVARAKENKARRFAFSEEDSDDSRESEDDDDVDNTTSDED